jgi:MHS family proline/betaine transporter-like MFS transporter
VADGGGSSACAGHRVSNRSIAVAALSTVVEWYDFTLYLYFATVLAAVFFGGGEASLAATLGGFAVAYLMRPVGAVVFGTSATARGGGRCCCCRWR